VALAALMPPQHHLLPLLGVMLTGLCSARGSAALLWDQRQTQGQGDAKSAQQEEQREQGGGGAAAVLALITGKVKQK